MVKNTAPVKSNLNNHRNQPNCNSNLKKPLKINNNLAGSLKKGNAKTEKNLQPVNESVRNINDLESIMNCFKY